MAERDVDQSSITFDVPSEVGVIIRRAAAAVRLDVADLPGGGFRVELREPINAYDLGNACVTDPAWAGVFLRRR